MRLWNKLVLMQNSRSTKLIFLKDCNAVLKHMGLLYVEVKFL